MIQKDKELLLKDLSARLPYGIKCRIKGERSKILIGINPEGLLFRGRTPDKSDWCYDCYDIEEWSILPYLRPLSSMTEEEKKDILQLLNIHGDIDNEGNLLLGVECNIVTLKVCKKYLGELNKRMFDVCHMIEKGLALEAPEGMYTLNK